MSTVTTDVVRDLDADLAICEEAKSEHWIADGSRVYAMVGDNGLRIEVWSEERASFIAKARTGWPYAIRRAQDAERENDRLRNELNALRRELDQHHRSACYD